MKSLQKQVFLTLFLWRGVRDLNPRGPKDHRLSRLRLHVCPFGRLQPSTRLGQPRPPNIFEDEYPKKLPIYEYDRNWRRERWQYIKKN